MRSLKILGELGSISVIFGMFCVVLNLIVSNEYRPIPLFPPCIYMIGGGFVANFVFENYEGKIVASIVASLKNIISKILGVVKAYTTRVGGGPCPTEQSNDFGKKLRDRGNEYGTVTKRPRRCGWFDAVAVRYTARIGGVDALSLMLLDVLSTFETIQVCTAYELDGRQMHSFPGSSEDLWRVQPVYETLPGWSEDITGVRKFDDLPVNAQNYVKRISELVGKPIELVSVGPDREQTISMLS